MSVLSQRKVFELESSRCLGSAHNVYVINSDDLRQGTYREGEYKLSQFSQGRSRIQCKSDRVLAEDVEQISTHL